MPQHRTTQVTVWLMNDGDPPKKEKRLLKALAALMGDADEAVAIAEGTHERSSFPWKGIIAGPVFYETGEVIAKWVESAGGRAIVDDGMYDDVPWPRA